MTAEEKNGRFAEHRREEFSNGRRNRKKDNRDRTSEPGYGFHLFGDCICKIKAGSDRTGACTVPCRDHQSGDPVCSGAVSVPVPEFRKMSGTQVKDVEFRKTKGVKSIFP